MKILEQTGQLPNIPNILSQSHTPWTYRDVNKPLPPSQQPIGPTGQNTQTTQQLVPVHQQNTQLPSGNFQNINQSPKPVGPDVNPIGQEVRTPQTSTLKNTLNNVQNSEIGQAGKNFAGAVYHGVENMGGPLALATGAGLGYLFGKKRSS